MTGGTVASVGIDHTISAESRPAFWTLTSGAPGSVSTVTSWVILKNFDYYSYILRVKVEMLAMFYLLLMNFLVLVTPF